MRKINKIIIFVMFFAVLLLGIGYASIQNVTLNINGKAIAERSKYNSKAIFIDDPILSDENYITSNFIDEETVQINVEGLLEKGQKVSAIYTLQNLSEDHSVNLFAIETNNNTEFFSVNSEFEKKSLEIGESTLLTVTTELIETPLENVSSQIEVQVVSIPTEIGENNQDPIQPPEENKETTIGDITNNNIGDYIDLGNNIIGTESTSDDWRIFYKEDDKVYAILADYLPASLVPKSQILSTDITTYPYSVRTKKGRDALIEELKNEELWHIFTNGINGATANGTPTVELLINSYNIKNSTELNYNSYPKLDSTTKDYDLYVPKTEPFENCNGYWFASTSSGEGSILLWGLLYTGNINYHAYNNGYIGIRPVVTLPSNIVCNYSDGIWVIE